MSAAAEIDVYKEWLGIPEGPRPPDHYSLLRLKQFEDDTEKVRANYKKLNAHVRKYATGQYSEQSQALLNELAKAMLCLNDAERKLEYDRGLGREIEEDTRAKKTIDVILIEQGHVTKEQVREAETIAEQMGLELRDALVQKKYVDPAIAAQALAQELGLPFVDLSELIPEDEVLDRLPKSVVKPNTILPLFIDGDVVLIASANLLDAELEKELQMRYEHPVRSVLAAPKAIEQGIAKYYAPGLRKDPAPTSGKKGAAKSTTAAKEEKPKVKLSADEQQDALKKNRMMAILCVNFSVFAAYLIWNFFTNRVLFGPIAAALFLGLPLVTAGVVYVMLWNKKE